MSNELNNLAEDQLSLMHEAIVSLDAVEKQRAGYESSRTIKDGEHLRSLVTEMHYIPDAKTQQVTKRFPVNDTERKYVIMTMQKDPSYIELSAQIERLQLEGQFYKNMIGYYKLKIKSLINPDHE